MQPTTDATKHATVCPRNASKERPAAIARHRWLKKEKAIVENVVTGVIFANVEIMITMCTEQVRIVIFFVTY